MSKHEIEGAVSGVAWWLRIVGTFYLLQFVAVALVRAPIRSLAPVDALARSAAGDRLAMFLVDTWVTFGLETGALGVGLLAASRTPGRAQTLIWAILAVEVGRGIMADIYMIARGYPLTVPVIWIVIHAVVLATGSRCLSQIRQGAEPR